MTRGVDAPSPPTTELDFAARARRDFGRELAPIPQYVRVEGVIARLERCADDRHRAAIITRAGALHVVSLADNQAAMFRERGGVALDNTRGSVRMTPTTVQFDKCLDR